MASASAGAIESTVSFSVRSSVRHRTVFVQTISSTSGWSPIRFERSAGEQPVRAGHPDRPRLQLAQPVQQLQDRAALGDLVVEHDDVPARDLADDRR